MGKKKILTVSPPRRKKTQPPTTKGRRQLTTKRGKGEGNLVVVCRKVGRLGIVE